MQVPKEILYFCHLLFTSDLINNKADNFGYLIIRSVIRCLSVHPLTFPFSAFLPFFISYFALALS